MKILRALILLMIVIIVPIDLLVVYRVFVKPYVDHGFSRVRIYTLSSHSDLNAIFNAKTEKESVRVLTDQTARSYEEFFLTLIILASLTVVLFKLDRRLRNKIKEKEINTS